MGTVTVRRVRGKPSGRRWRAAGDAGPLFQGELRSRRADSSAAGTLNGERVPFDLTVSGDDLGRNGEGVWERSDVRAGSLPRLPGSSAGRATSACTQPGAAPEACARGIGSGHERAHGGLRPMPAGAAA